MAALVVVQGPEKSKEYPLSEGIILGRSFDCGIRLDDMTVSRRHAQITPTADGWVIEDMGSGNGTMLNGKELTAPAPLQDGALIQIGDTALKFLAKTTEPPQVRAASVTMMAPSDASKASILNTLDVRATQRGVPTPASLEELKALHERLQTVLSVSNAVQTEFNQEKLLGDIMDRLLIVFPQMDRGFVLMRDDEKAELAPVACKTRSGETAAELCMSRTIIDEVTNNCVAVLSADAMGDSRFGGAMSIVNMQMRSMMCVPLIANEELLGIIHVDTMRQGRKFNKDDLELLTAIANQVSFAVANAKMHNRLMKRQRMERDLQLARQVQHSFLPSSTHKVPRMAFTSSYRAALEVGGDFYDFIQASPQRIAIVVGDVSGKGIPAALMMAKMTSDVRTFAMSEPEPKDILAKLNQRVGESTTTEQFVTMFLAVVDTETREMKVSSAAHCPPIVRRSAEGELIELATEGSFPIGIVSDAEFPQQEFKLEAGDTVVVFTDGVSEAMNEQKEQYGDERIQKALSSGPSDPGTLMKVLLDVVQKHVAGAYQSDDLTLICFGAT